MGLELGLELESLLPQLMVMGREKVMVMVMEFPELSHRLMVVVMELELRELVLLVLHYFLLVAAIVLMVVLLAVDLATVREMEFVEMV
jgi:hypothetical protein